MTLKIEQDAGTEIASGKNLASISMTPCLDVNGRAWGVYVHAQAPNKNDQLNGRRGFDAFRNEGENRSRFLRTLR
jgi:hypothetical protein